MTIYLNQLLINAGLTSKDHREVFNSYGIESYKKVGRPSKVEIEDLKLFLKVFKQVRKSLKRGNQYDVAIKVKRLFKNAFNIDYWLQDEVAFTQSHDLDEVAVEENRKKLLKIIKLTDLTYYWYFCMYEQDYYDQAYNEALTRLAVYFFNASPAAMLQMRKRFLVKVVRIN